MINFRSTFECIPGNSILVQADSPDFTVLAVTDDFVKTSGKSKEILVGKGLFEIFPSNPEAEEDKGEQNLKKSFNYILNTKKAHEPEVIRYDVQDQDGTFAQRFWQSKNRPVFDENGNVKYIIHTAEEVTTKVLSALDQERQKKLFDIENLFRQAPIAIHVFRGPDLIIQMANEPTLKLWDREKNVIGKPLREALPEIATQGYLEKLNLVRTSGIPLYGHEAPVKLHKNNTFDIGYYNYVFQPYYENNKEEAVGVLAFANEVTDLVKAKQKLQESESRFLQLANSLPIVVWTAGTDGGLTFISNQWEEIYGNPINQSLGAGWAQFVHPDDVHEAAAIWHNSLQSGQPYETEFRVRHKEGGYHWVLVRALPVRNSDGVIVSWNGSNTDIQEKKQSESILKENEFRYRTLIEASTIATALMSGPEMTIQYVNALSLKYWSKDISILGKPIRKALPELHGENFFEQLENVYATGKPFIGIEKKTNLIVDGVEQTFYLNFTYKALKTSEGIIYAIHQTVEDVSREVYARKAIKESERNLRNTILQSPAAMAIFKGPNFILELANKRMYEIIGKGPEVLLNKPLFESLPESKGQGFEELLNNVYETGIPFAANEVPAKLVRNNQLESIYLNFAYEAYKESDGTISGIIVVAVDVTDQVHAKIKIEEIVEKRTRDLEASKNNLQKSNDELAQFAYVASHDLQEPLRKIRVFSNLLEQNLHDLLDEESRSYMEKINASSLRMNALIKDVLKYSQLVKDKEIFESVNLNKVLAEILTDYELLISEKKATIEICDLPVIQAIPLQMSQLIGNLLGNALKFAKKDQLPVITISCRVLDKSELENTPLNTDLNYYRIQFTDNGIGFKPEYAERIFSIFQRLHRKTEYDGTGIGLALCKKIVLNHHGEINADGSNENGAVFNVFLPAKQK